MARTYDPDMDNVYVRREGSILWDGEEIGHAAKTDPVAKAMGAWRAEIGDAADPEKWPGYRASYARTRAAAVADVLEGVAVPGEEN